MMNSWKLFFRNDAAKWLMGLTLLFTICVLVCFYFFLAYNEVRPGKFLEDPVLSRIPAYDVSVPIFLLTYFLAVAGLILCVQEPEIFLQLVLSYGMLTLCRMISMYLLPLEPPRDIIPLVDPLLKDSFYAGRPNLKDLFFSGHTATIYLFYFLLRKKVYRSVFLVGGTAVAVLILVQHAHYAIDVAVAPVFALLVVKWSDRIVSRLL